MQGVYKINGHKENFALYKMRGRKNFYVNGKWRDLKPLINYPAFFSFQ